MIFVVGQMVFVVGQMIFVVGQMVFVVGQMIFVVRQMVFVVRQMILVVRQMVFVVRQMVFVVGQLSVRVFLQTWLNCLIFPYETTTKKKIFVPFEFVEKARTNEKRFYFLSSVNFVLRIPNKNLNLLRIFGVKFKNQWTFG